MATTGWVAKTAPATVLDGLASKLSAVAAPMEMKKLFDCTLMIVASSVDSVALAARTYSPAASRDTPLNVATPATARTVVTPLSTPQPLATVSVIVRFDVVTVLPSLSVTVTTGCVGNEAPPVLAEGLVVKFRLLALSRSVLEEHDCVYVTGAFSSLQNDAGQYFGTWLQFASHHVSVHVLAMHL
jgi:hypothetical protein